MEQLLKTFRWNYKIILPKFVTMDFIMEKCSDQKDRVWSFVTNPAVTSSVSLCLLTSDTPERSNEHLEDGYVYSCAFKDLETDANHVFAYAVLHGECYVFESVSEKYTMKVTKLKPDQLRNRINSYDPDDYTIRGRIFKNHEDMCKHNELIIQAFYDIEIKDPDFYNKVVEYMSST